MNRIRYEQMTNVTINGKHYGVIRNQRGKYFFLMPDDDGVIGPFETEADCMEYIEDNVE